MEKVVENVNDNDNQYNIIQDKLEYIEINNNWNDVNEQMIVSIAENAAGYKWLHEHSSKFYGVLNKLLGISLIFFNSALSTETFLRSEDNNSIESVKNFFTYFATAISVIQTFFRFDENAAHHKSSSISFSNLYHNIQLQMSKYRKNRESADIFLSNSLKELDSLILNSPTVSTYASLYFKYIFKGNKIELPDMRDLLNKVSVADDKRYPIRTVSIQANNSTLKAPERAMTALNSISQISCIQGDITDKDVKEYRERLAKKIEFEQERFKIHMESYDAP